MISTSVVSLNRPMKVLTMPGMTIFSACGRMISRIILQYGRAESHRPLVLPLRDGLETAPDHLGHVGGGEERHADDRAQELIERHVRRQEQRGT